MNEQSTINTRTALDELARLAHSPADISTAQVMLNIQMLTKRTLEYRAKAKTSQNINALVYASLAAYANYFLFLRGNISTVTWLEECETLVKQLKQANTQRTFTTNSVLLQSLLIFLLAHKTHVLIMSKKDRASVMQAFDDCCTQFKIYKSVVANKALNQTELRNGVALSKPWKSIASIK